MKLVVGLGNPGEKYRNTRHNVGFMVVDELQKHVDWRKVAFLKPQKFMNKSGVVVKQALRKSPNVKDDDIYVVHDDLDIELGKYKISLGKGPKDHNGLRNIYEQIGSEDFWHVRVGIDAPRGNKSGEEYVLSRWRMGEKKVVEKTIKKLVKELSDVLA